ncbi:hypothetical protein [Methanobacterium paludis]|uniref:Uncharacterized protein n=1 Tax=Methanobacterium paludis (strain DSM 25820 / JCM 18151 / SWAN1) TaxID=868131 RepID=F6D4U4_METPW|nr:hypothetical protein [Methanobacterium paludis]AEG18153.1 hypothetical protein MSWAN_1135 [Methanobacterium paludis]
MAGRPSAVKKSPYKKEIEEMITEGKPDTYIVEWLKENGAPISRPTINKYRKKDFNFKAEAVKEYQKQESKKRFNKAKNKIVSDLNFLDGLIETAAGTELCVDEEQGITSLDINKLGVQAAKVKHDITKDEPPVVVEVKAGELDDDERKLAKAVADYFARQGENSEEPEPER